MRSRFSFYRRDGLDAERDSGMFHFEALRMSALICGSGDFCLYRIAGRS